MNTTTVKFLKDLSSYLDLALQATEIKVSREALDEIRSDCNAMLKYAASPELQWTRVSNMYPGTWAYGTKPNTDVEAIALAWPAADSGCYRWDAGRLGGGECLGLDNAMKAAENALKETP